MEQEKDDQENWRDNEELNLRPNNTQHQTDNNCISQSFSFVYIEQVINECKLYCTGIELNEVRIQMLRFADDMTVVAQDEINLKRALESLDDILKSNYKMKINKEKDRSYDLLQRS